MVKPREWVYTAELDHVVDGDTLDMRLGLEIDPGFDERVTWSAVRRFRVAGIDCPEVDGPTAAMGRRAAEYVSHLLADARALQVVSLGRADKYGRRWDGRILAQGIDSGASRDVWTDLGPFLLRRGYAKPYSGKGPRPTWDPAQYPLVVPA